MSSNPLLLRRYPNKSPYGKYSKTINSGSGILKVEVEGLQEIPSTHDDVKWVLTEILQILDSQSYTKSHLLVTLVIRAFFTCLPKVIHICFVFFFCITAFYDWFKKLRHFLSQSEVKPKPIVNPSRPCFPRFAPAILYLIHVWTFWLGYWISCYIGYCEYSGFGCTTINSKLLYVIFFEKPGSVRWKREKKNLILGKPSQILNGTPPLRNWGSKYHTDWIG